MSASIGITLYPDDTTDFSQLLKNADQAMYAAKSHGRNNYRFFTAAMQEALKNRALLLNELHTAICEQQFTLRYQPIVDLSTGGITMAEALLRWQHPRNGLIGPDEFIPLAEETGLINDVGDWVFQRVAAQLLEWRHTVHPQFQLSINKSPLQFLNSRCGSLDWEQYLLGLGLPGEALVMEINESILLQTNQILADRLLNFRESRIQVAINDFGSGYSALSHLKKFAINYLKINHAFIAQLKADSDELALCEAIVVMAHKLGLKVIAVGVETQQQRDLLVNIGCDYGQGNWFSKPLPVEEFTQRYGVCGQ